MSRSEEVGVDMWDEGARALCAYAYRGCGPLIGDEGYESPEQEATPAVLACPVCGNDVPRCRYHWEEHVEDHTRLAAQLVAHNSGYYALARENGWYETVPPGAAADQWRSREYLEVLREEFDRDESRIPAALRGGLVAADKRRQAFVKALRSRDLWDVDEDFAGLAAYVRHWQEVIRGLDDAEVEVLAGLGQVARLGKESWARECERADRVNGCTHRDASCAEYCPSCGWSCHQTWCYTDRCPWCEAIAPLCTQCDAGA